MPRPKKSVISDPVLFISKDEVTTIIIESTQKVFMNNRMVRLPGIRAEFIAHRCLTRDPKVIDGLRDLLNGPEARQWQRVFREAPSQEILKKVSRHIAEVKAEAEKVKREVSGGDEYQEFNDFVKQIPDESKKYVKGMAGTMTNVESS